MAAATQVYRSASLRAARSAPRWARCRRSSPPPGPPPPPVRPAGRFPRARRLGSGGSARHRRGPRPGARRPAGPRDHRAVWPTSSPPRRPPRSNGRPSALGPAVGIAPVCGVRRCRPRTRPGPASPASTAAAAAAAASRAAQARPTSSADRREHADRPAPPSAARAGSRRAPEQPHDHQAVTASATASTTRPDQSARRRHGQHRRRCRPARRSPGRARPCSRRGRCRP